MELAGNLLSGLVALACNEHNVASSGLRHSPRNRGSSVHVHVSGLCNSNKNVIHDSLRRLRAWVVGGDHHNIGQLICDRSHLWAFATVAVSTAAEDDE
jgi:hypothetical protein